MQYDMKNFDDLLSKTRYLSCPLKVRVLAFAERFKHPYCFFSMFKPDQPFSLSKLEFFSSKPKLQNESSPESAKGAGGETG